MSRLIIFRSCARDQEEVMHRSRNAALLIVSLTASVEVYGQGRSGAPTTPPKNAKEAAPADLTGQWVSVVTEDWRYRMILPKKGEYGGIPISPAGRKLADSWD